MTRTSRAPFGWRFMSAIVGTLAVLIVARIARRMTRSNLLGCVAGLVFSLDGLEYVQSRVAMLDIFLMFWTVVGFACLILDRDQVRGRLADRATNNTNGSTSKFGPHTGMRWWLLACGVAVGWCVRDEVGRRLLDPVVRPARVLLDDGARRAIGVEKPFRATLVRDTLPSVSWMVAVPVVVYTAS